MRRAALAVALALLLLAVILLRSSGSSGRGSCGRTRPGAPEPVVAPAPEPEPPEAEVEPPPAPEPEATVEPEATAEPESEPDEPLEAHAPLVFDAALPAIVPRPSLGPTLRYVHQSTVKMEQLVGELDKERHQVTRSRTVSRYGLEGADLGYSFEHRGQTIFLFGDTVGVAGGALDSMAEADLRDPEGGVRLDFFTDGRGRYMTVQPPGLPMGGFEVPISGVSVGGEMYVVVKTDHGPGKTSTTTKSVLTKYVPPTSFAPLRVLSSLPGGRFVTPFFHHEPPGAITTGLPSGGPFVFEWGLGELEQSNVYFSVVPERSFESGQGTLYFTGFDGEGAPTWSRSESDARPVMGDGTIRYATPTWCPELRLWLMVYVHKGILFTYSKDPWGPFSDPQVIFRSKRDHALGVYMHDAKSDPDDGLEGPTIGPAPAADPRGTASNAYGPSVVERWTRVSGHELTIYYVLSTWNPYVVVLMKSIFHVAHLR